MNLEKALLHLINEEVVAIPTETVYGLAGRIDSEKALRKIFSVKERPFFDPLIVHVASIEQAKNLVTSFPAAAEKLAKDFWPGPLTLVLKKNDKVSPLITAGLESVGLRMPNHQLTLKLIQRLGVPVAAPSANKFGRTSPTKSSHVQSEFKNDHVYILEGGDCEVGLESTVLLLQENQQSQVEFKILRLGMISKKQITSSLQSAGFKAIELEELDGRLSPGNLKYHYMPIKPLVILKNNKSADENLSSIRDRFAQIKLLDPEVNSYQSASFEKFSELILDHEPSIAARQLYSQMRDIAALEGDFILFRMLLAHHSPEFAPIMDKIFKASSVVID